MSEQAVVELVHRWADVERNGDVDAYGDILDEDFRGIGPVGFVLDGEQWAARHRNGLRNEEFTVSDQRVRTFGDTAIVDAVQRQRTVAMGHESNGSFRIAVVAVRRDNRWVIANVQFSGPLIAPGEKPAFVKTTEG